MKWSNVRLILGREIRDQLRDRRTLFMIAILPLLLYPLLGMAFMQISHFFKANPSRVYLAGVGELPESPALIEDGQIAESVYSSANRVGLISLTVSDDEPSELEDPAEAARRLLVEDGFDAVVYFPPQFGDNLQRFRASVGTPATASGQPTIPAVVDVPGPAIFYNTAKERSLVAHDRIAAALNRWRQRVVEQTLESHQVSERATSPFAVVDNDLAKPEGRRAALWSKMLPFVMLVWALTGAFYPAIDLCAGEKERGTLETLLSSPAQRSEIVMGKLLTIMLFSMATALLNLFGMAFTATFIVAQLRGLGPIGANLAIGPPPLETLWWLVVALVPISALFSALSLALATMARSTKEGQYYLMPLLLICMPLLILPMLPNMELSLGTSLIPITGVMLLLRRFMEGEFREAIVFLLPAAAVTFGCCLLAVRWAIDQFNNESVLFRETERLDLGRWLLHLVRDRNDTPTVGMAVTCGLLILILRFFVGMALPVPESWLGIVVIALVSLIGLIAVPALLMTFLLTRRPRMTLLLRRAPTGSVLAAVALAVCLHPILMAFAQLVQYVYPIQEGSLSHFALLLGEAPSIWLVLLIAALAPAICEELAFRGFILSGLRHAGHKWRAILFSSVLFGVAHGMLQQSLMATASGAILGYLAVQTGSLLPCMAFHLIHNSLSLMIARLVESSWESHPQYHWLLRQVGELHFYWWPILLASAVMACLILNWFRRLAYDPTEEERFQQALDRKPADGDATNQSHDPAAELAPFQDETDGQELAAGSGTDLA